MKYYFGYDVSSSAIGVSVMDEDKKIIVSKALLFDPKKETLEQRAQFFEQDLKIMLTKYKPCDIFVEEPAKAFGQGSSNAQTIGTLQRFNGMICYAIYRNTKIQANLINARSARKLVGIPYVRGLSTTQLKKYLTRHVKEMYDDFEIVYTTKGNLKRGIADKADSVIVNLAGMKTGEEESERT